MIPFWKQQISFRTNVTDPGSSGSRRRQLAQKQGQNRVTTSTESVIVHFEQLFDIEAMQNEEDLSEQTIEISHSTVSNAEFTSTFFAILFPFILPMLTKY